MSASTKRSGEKMSSGGCSTTTRTAETAAWLTSMVPPPKKTAAAIARSTTTAIWRVPFPITSTRRSATMSPTATPKTSSTARLFLWPRSEEHTSELQSRQYLVCRLLLEKKKRHHNFYSIDTI